MHNNAISEAYVTLGLENGVEPAKVKKAYRQLSLLHHPDKNGNSKESNAKFQKLTAAYTLLTSENHVQVPIQNKGGHSWGCTIRPLEIILSLTLEKCYSGVMEPVKVLREVKTTDGRIMSESETMYVHVPEGTDSGEVITYRRKGHIVETLGKGDLRVIIRSLEHENFVRRGLDLHYVQRMTLKQALCGFTYQLNHPSGKTVELRNKFGTIVDNTHVKVVKNLGMKRGEYKGDMHIRFVVALPKTLSTHQLTVLKETL
tara:strand:- start:7665 stop:8438 length:774 start_codon:yes stop_codon:yes gene_type:complete